MRKNYIGEISDLFKIPASTLRYWENQSLLEFARDKKNNYRFPSFRTLLSIWDIVFYRELSIPLKEIKLIPSMNIDDLEHTLAKNKEKLINELHNLEKTIKNIESKENNIEKIRYLKSNSFSIEKSTFPSIKLLNNSDEKIMQAYIFHPDRCVVVIDSEKSIFDFGIFITETDNDIFREKDACEKLYLKSLLKIDPNDVTNTNCSELILRAEKLGYKTGTMIGKYLISACEDKRYDYYETWIELL